MAEVARPGEAELVLVRHGETTGESRIRLNGRTDVPLSALGQAQMRRVAPVLERLGPFDRALTTPLTRARESARLAGVPDALVVPEFIEVDFGNWERLTYAEVQARDPAVYAAMAAPDFRYPGGESRQGFRARIAAGVDRWLRPATGRTAAVLHKGVIKAALGALLGPDAFATPCDLGSIHRLVRRGGEWRSIGLNEVEHLLPDLHLADEPVAPLAKHGAS